MSILKFRVIFEDDDSIFRDIEVKPLHSFADLEAAIIASYNMPATGSGSFFQSNDNWQRGRQLHPSVKKEEQKKATRAKATSLPSMVAYIDDPHQHFIYEFHGNQDAAFLIELVTIGGTEKDTAMYPAIVKSQGTSPFKKEELAAQLAKRKSVVPDHKTEVEVLIEEAMEEDDDEKDEVSPFIESADEVDAEELATIEGEEGDLMEGDAIKEEADESGDDAFVAGDDFDAEDLSENIAEDSEEEF